MWYIRKLVSYLFGVLIAGELVLLLGSILWLLIDISAQLAVSTGVCYLCVMLVALARKIIKGGWKWALCFLILGAYWIFQGSQASIPQPSDAGNGARSLEHTLPVICMDTTIGPALDTIKDIRQDLQELGKIVSSIGTVAEQFDRNSSDYIVERQAVLAAACGLKFSTMAAYIAEEIKYLEGDSARGVDDAGKRKVQAELRGAVERAVSCQRTWEEVGRPGAGARYELEQEIGIAQHQVVVEKRNRRAGNDGQGWASKLVAAEHLDNAMSALDHALEASRAFGEAYDSSRPCMLLEILAVEAAFNSTQTSYASKRMKKSISHLEETLQLWDILVIAHEVRP